MSDVPKHAGKKNAVNNFRNWEDNKIFYIPVNGIKKFYYGLMCLSRKDGVIRDFFA